MASRADILAGKAYVRLALRDNLTGPMAKTLGKFGKSLKSTGASLAGIGSGEVMKKYGVIVSEAAVKQELMNQGIDPKAADNQAKVQARLNIIMRGTTAAQGDAIRTSGSFTNQMKGLKAKIKDTAVEIGTSLIPAVIGGVVKGGVLCTTPEGYSPAAAIVTRAVFTKLLIHSNFSLAAYGGDGVLVVKG